MLLAYVGVDVCGVAHGVDAACIGDIISAGHGLLEAYGSTKVSRVVH